MTQEPIKTPTSLSLTRRGFTLVEMLVVIAIIGILAALTAVGVWAVFGNQQRRNTESTITTVNKVLQDHWKYVIEEAKKDSISQAGNQAVWTLAQPDPTGQRFRVLWIKFRLMEAFPQRFTDITNPFPYTALPGSNPPQYFIPPGQQRYIADYQKKLTAGLRPGATTQPLTESAACLLLALSVNRGGSVLNQDQIKFAVKDSDGDGIPELVDSFSVMGNSDASKTNPPLSANPLAFFRFPWNNATLQNANPAVAGTANKAYADPTDSNGMLITNSWVFTQPPPVGNSRTYFEANFHSVTWGPNHNLPQWPAVGNLQGTYVTPVVLSAGKDGVFGLNTDANGYFLPEMSVNPALATKESDNIYGYQLRGN